MPCELKEKGKLPKLAVQWKQAAKRKMETNSTRLFSDRMTPAERMDRVNEYIPVDRNKVGKAVLSEIVASGKKR